MIHDTVQGMGLYMLDDGKSDSQVTVELFSSFDKILSLQEEWDAFVGANGADIFMTYDWCRIWWKYYGKGRDLKIFIFRNNDELVGIIPVFMEKIWLGPVFVKAVKIVGSDFTLAQFSLQIRDCFLKEVVEGLVEKLYGLDWDIIHVGSMAGKYGSFLDVEKALSYSFNSFAVVRLKERDVQTYFDLAESWENQFLTLSKRERGDIRRNYRYIAKVIDDIDKPVQIVVADSNNIQEIFNNFVEMHKDHWNRLNKAGHFGDWPDSKEFHYEQAKVALKRGRLRLLKININDICLGYEYDYKCGHNYFEVLNARTSEEKYKNISLGKIIFCEQAKKAIKEKVGCIDSMRGKYDHKIKMGGKLYPIRSLFVIRKKFLVSIRVNIFLALARLFNILYYKIWFCRLAPKLPFRRRLLWKLWIRTRL